MTPGTPIPERARRRARAATTVGGAVRLRVIIGLFGVVGFLSLVASAGSTSATADTGTATFPGGTGASRAGPDDGGGVGPRYRPPTHAPVIDGFRPPATAYGPGNRGLEYDTVPGEPIRSIGPGVVMFAGPVAGRLVVSVAHPDGRRSSYTGLGGVTVAVGDVVAGGSTIGRAGELLHLGVRVGDRYIDPALLFVGAPPRPTHAVLVPTGRG